MTVNIVNFGNIIIIRSFSRRIFKGSIQRGVIPGREHLMRMRESDSVDACYFTQLVDVILGAFSSRQSIKACMSHSDDNINTLSFHQRNKLLGCFADIFNFHLTIQVRFVPLHDLRSYQT
ncbi:hypothetical protein D3C75_798530 [compost metagenome]